MLIFPNGQRNGANGNGTNGSAGTNGHNGQEQCIRAVSTFRTQTAEHLKGVMVWRLRLRTLQRKLRRYDCTHHRERWEGFTFHERTNEETLWRTGGRNTIGRIISREETSRMLNKKRFARVWRKGEEKNYSSRKISRRTKKKSSKTGRCTCKNIGALTKENETLQGRIATVEEEAKENTALVDENVSTEEFLIESAKWEGRVHISNKSWESSGQNERLNEQQASISIM